LTWRERVIGNSQLRRKNVPYFVTFEESYAAALDIASSRPFELADAITHAFQLIDENRPNVALRDDKEIISVATTF
jgi:hypothetical protein